MIARIAAPVRTWHRFVLLGLLLGALLVGNAETLGARKLDSLTFVKAEVPLVLKALADISGANIVIASGVQGTITLSLKDVTVEEALEIITKMSGLTYAYTDGAYLVGATTGPTQVLQEMNREYLIINPIGLAPADVQNALSATFPDITVKLLTPGSKIVLVGKKERLTAASAFLDEISGTPTPGVLTPRVDLVEASYRVKSIVPWQAKLFLEQSFGARGLKVVYAPSARWVSSAAPAADWTSDVLMLRGPQAVIDEALASLAKVDEEAPYTEVRTHAKRIFGTQAIAYLLERFEARGLTITTAPMTVSDVALISGKATPSPPPPKSATLASR